ncbi:MAG: Holliday junction branch migration protein RuvA [Pseudomonadota bacterium]|jgi:Holliday junction DNA helicase RuvA
MIGKISGRLDWRGNDHVLIDVRGVGYIVHVSERTLRALPGLGEAVALYTELLVREDLLQLFGFPTMLEKEWHKLLMTVQGVGAKAAMAILGTLGAEGAARAITLGDARAIQSAPGVGPKLAQRVILELKAKAPGVMAMGGSLTHLAEPDEADAVIEPAAPPRAARAMPAADAARQARAAASADALSALANLGYGPGDAAQAVATAAMDAPEADTAALIRAALKLLAPKG